MSICAGLVSISRWMDICFVSKWLLRIGILRWHGHWCQSQFSKIRHSTRLFMSIFNIYNTFNYIRFLFVFDRTYKAQTLSYGSFTCVHVHVHVHDTSMNQTNRVWSKLFCLLTFYSCSAPRRYKHAMSPGHTFYISALSLSKLCLIPYLVPCQCWCHRREHLIVNLL